MTEPRVNAGVRPPTTAARAAARVVGSPARPVELPLRRERQASARDLTRLMLAQAALLLGAVSLVIARPTLAAFAAGVTIVAAALLLRRRGRWLTVHSGIVWRYRRRHGRQPAGSSALRSLHRLAPDLAVEDVTGP